jgi:flagellar secretion chaperone FliS
MMSSDGYKVYREARAHELNQTQLILMMYAGAINFLTKAVEEKNQGKDKMGKYVSKAKNVILELMASLDLDKGGEMAVLLLKTYKVIFMKLSSAFLNDDTVKVTEVRDLLTELETSWKQIAIPENKQSLPQRPLYVPQPNITPRL